MRSQHKEHLERKLSFVFAPESTGPPAKHKSRILFLKPGSCERARRTPNFLQSTLGRQRNRKGGGPGFFHDGFPDASDESGPPDTQKGHQQLHRRKCFKASQRQQRSCGTPLLRDIRVFLMISSIGRVRKRGPPCRKENILFSCFWQFCSLRF